MRLYSLIRAVAFVALFFFLLPGAFVLTNQQLGWPRWQHGALDSLGALFFAAGVVVCVHCAALFSTLGSGTPVPSQPPEQLVVSGMYRFVRHPIYVAYVSIGLGIFLAAGHLALVLYPAVLFLLAQIYLAKVEEPALLERFGPAYVEYRERVPRWPWSRRQSRREP